MKWPFEWNTNRASAAVLASVLVVSGAVVAIAGTAPPATLQRYLGDGLLIIDTKAGSLPDGQQASSYVHLVPATAVPNARGAVPGTITDVAQGGGGAVITAQANGGNDYYAVSAKTLTPTRLKVTNYERGRKAKGVMVQTGTAPDTDYYYAKRTGSTYVRLVPENSGSRTPKPVRFGSKIEVIGGTDGTLLVAQPGEAKASAVISGRLKAAVSLGTPDPTNRLQTTLVDGRPVAVNPATGAVVAFDAGRVAHRSDLPVTGSMRIASKYETGELVAIVDAPDGPTVVAVQVGTGESRTIPIPADALDGAAPPVVTPDHIYLYTRAEGPGSLRAFDARTGVEADPIDFGGDAGRIPPGAKVEVADGRVVVDVQNSRDAWVIDRPGADGTTKVDKESEGIEDVTKRAVQPPPPPPTTVPGPGAGQGGGNGRGGGPIISTPLIVAPPSAPVLVGEASSSAANLSWSVDTAGAPVFAYSVECSPACPGNSSPEPGVTSFVLTNLKNGTTYVVSLTVTTAGGSAKSNEVTVRPTAGAPGVPEAVRATANSSDGTVTVSWRANADDGTTGVSGFQITYPGSGGALTVGPGETSWTSDALSGRYGLATAFTILAVANAPSSLKSPASVSNSVIPSAPASIERFVIERDAGGAHQVKAKATVRWNGSRGSFTFDAPFTGNFTESRASGESASLGVPWDSTTSGTGRLCYSSPSGGPQSCVNGSAQAVQVLRPWLEAARYTQSGCIADPSGINTTKLGAHWELRAGVDLRGMDPGFLQRRRVYVAPNGSSTGDGGWMGNWPSDDLVWGGWHAGYGRSFSVTYWITYPDQPSVYQPVFNGREPVC